MTRASCPTRRRGRPAAEPPHGLLPADPRDPAFRLGRSSGHRRLLRRDRQLGRHARRRDSRRSRCTASCASSSATSTHLNAYISLVANPYPGFVGEEGDYPIDVKLPPPEPSRTARRRSCGSSSRSRRCSCLLRSAARGSFRVPSRGRTASTAAAGGGCARRRMRIPRLVRRCLARGRMPQGPARRGGLQHRLQRADARVRPARHRPLPERRPDGDARDGRAAAAAPGAISSATRTTCGTRA